MALQPEMGGVRVLVEDDPDACSSVPTDLLQRQGEMYVVDTLFWKREIVARARESEHRFFLVDLDET